MTADSLIALLATAAVTAITIRLAID